MTAAQYAARAGLSVMVIEQAFLGGQCGEIDALENYPGFPDPINGVEFSERFERQARAFGAEFLDAEVTRIERPTANPERSVGQVERPTSLQDQPAGRLDSSEGERLAPIDSNFKLRTSHPDHPTLAARTVILATGAAHRTLDVPGERELQGRGVSYCATCDGPLFKDKRILVVGGGDAACDEAGFLSKLTDRVVLIHRRDRFRAQAALVERVQNNPHIEVRLNTVADQIHGAPNHFGIEAVSAVTLRDTITGQTTREPFDAVFVFVGSTPRTALAEDAEKDEAGYLRTDKWMQTSVPGLFAVGDVRDTVFRQLVVAAADGAIAAHGAAHHIERHHHGNRR